MGFLFLRKAFVRDPYSGVKDFKYGIGHDRDGIRVVSTAFFSGLERLLLMPSQGVQDHRDHQDHLILRPHGIQKRMP